MKNITNITLLAILIIFTGLSSCDSSTVGKSSDVLTVKVDVSNIKDVIQKLKSDSLITINEINCFHYGVLNLGEAISGKTVKEIMAYGEKVMKEESVVELDNIANALIMKSAIEIKISNFEEIKDSSFYRVHVEFTNKSAEAIKTNSGKLRFLNNEGRYFMIPVENLTLNLQPNQKTGNYFDLKDTLKMKLDRLSNGDLKNLKSIDWLNTDVVFEGGRRITVLQNTGNTENR